MADIFDFESTAHQLKPMTSLIELDPDIWTLPRIILPHSAIELCSTS